MHDRLDNTFLQEQRRKHVLQALAEDLGLTISHPEQLDLSRDVTAALVSEEQWATAEVITREACVVCGHAWVNECFALLDARVSCQWAVTEGVEVAANTRLLTIQGPARALLTGERSALNFLQTLSATATQARRAVAQLPTNSRLKILDTRKTLPGLRAAQKYAVGVGGAHNHRIGLFDAFLIKENHIAACGSISAAIIAARKKAPDMPIEVEVETFSELEEALSAGADIIMLDEFSDSDLPRAVTIAAGRAKLEVSGSVHTERLQHIALAGVDYVSMGALTKHIHAIDLSMRVHLQNQ